MTLRFLRMFCVLLIVACAGSLMTGCGYKRPSRIVAPPVDLTDPTETEELEELVSTADIQLDSQQEYYLGPGDVIGLQLLGRPDVIGGAENRDLLVEFEISDSPVLSLPLIGSIQVHDKTPSQLQEDLRVAYERFVRNPEPIVVVRRFARNQVRVMGAVASPGEYPYSFGDTVLDVLFDAGGLSTGGRGGGVAPGRYMKVYRERLTAEQQATLELDEILELITEDGLVIPREEIAIPIDDFLFNGTLTWNLPLRQNDVLYVLPAGTVNVQGYVQAPGVTFLGPSLNTVAQAITERGGLRTAAASQVEVVRSLPDGQTVSYFVNARRIMARREPDFRLRDGDQVVVYSTLPREVAEWLSDLFQGSVRAGASATYNPAI